jgi:hypothetical protein
MGHIELWLLEILDDEISLPSLKLFNKVQDSSNVLQNTNTKPWLLLGGSGKYF